MCIGKCVGLKSWGDSSEQIGGFQTGLEWTCWQHGNHLHFRKDFPPSSTPHPSPGFTKVQISPLGNSAQSVTLGTLQSPAWDPLPGLWPLAVIMARSCLTPGSWSPAPNF